MLKVKENGCIKIEVKTKVYKKWKFRGIEEIVDCEALMKDNRPPTQRRISESKKQTKKLVQIEKKQQYLNWLQVWKTFSHIG